LVWSLVSQSKKSWEDLAENEWLMLFKAMLTKGCRMEADTPLKVLCKGFVAE
jgi:hypothetical protein